MERAITVVGGNVVINNEKGLGLGSRIIIKTFLKSLGKLARPLLVSITAQILQAAIQSESDVSDFLKDVLEEVDSPES